MDTAKHYLEQTVTSARRIKLLNPTTNITVVTNPGITLEDMGGVFDMVRKRYVESPRRGG